MLLVISRAYLFFYFENATRDEFQILLRERSRYLVVQYLGRDLDFDFNELRNMQLNTITQESFVITDEKNRFLFTLGSPVNDKLKELIVEHKNNKDYFITERGRQGIVLKFTHKNEVIYVSLIAFDLAGNDRIAQYRTVLFTTLWVMLALAIIAGYYFSRSALNPMIKVIEEVEQINVGNLNKRVSGSFKKDEIGKLAQTFNELLERLEQRFEWQQQFLNHAAHELKTPITSILCETEFALLKERDEQSLKRAIMHIDRNALIMSDLVTSLLELAIQSKQKEGIQLEPVRVDELLFDLVESYNSRIQSADVNLEILEFPEDPDSFSVFGQKTLLLASLRNLVENGLKFSKGLPIVVKLHIDNDTISISFTDQGPGIESTDMNLLLEPFFRSDATKSIQGYGIGLSLVSKIIRIHKGEIKFEPASEQGTIVTVTFNSIKKRGQAPQSAKL